MIGDTAGSRGGNAGAKPGGGAKAVYVLDPPLPSDRRAHPDGRAYYASSSWSEPTGSPQTYLYRSFPAERAGTDPGFSFADGHAAAVSVDQIDDHNKDGIKDNGYWNGHGQCHCGPPFHWQWPCDPQSSLHGRDPGRGTSTNLFVDNFLIAVSNRMTVFTPPTMKQPSAGKAVFVSFHGAGFANDCAQP